MTSRNVPISEAQAGPLATLLGVAIGAGLDLGLSPEQLAGAFCRENVLAVARLLAADNTPAAR